MDWSEAVLVVGQEVLQPSFDHTSKYLAVKLILLLPDCVWELVFSSKKEKLNKTKTLRYLDFFVFVFKLSVA